MEKFYVVNTKSNQENRAKQNLINQGFNVWMPTFKTIQKKKNKFFNYDKPYFPNYLFVKFSINNDSWHKINNTFGVKALISNSGIPLHLNDNVISDIKNLIKGNYLKIGDYVKFVTGPLKNYKGKIINLSSNERVQILLNFLSKGTVILTQKKLIQKV